MYIGNTQNLLNNQRLAENWVSQISHRLASGLRINNGADDPSGLAISKSMTAQSRGSLVALQNVQDSASLINTMDGALNEIQGMLIRIKDLALRASNDAILRSDCQDRTRLNREARSLVSEIDREAQSVLFNGKKILSGDYLVNIAGTAGTQKIIESSATVPKDPGWADTNTVTYTAQVKDTGVQTGARPSAAGGTTNRNFDVKIDAANNPLAPTRTQLTIDPTTWTDGDTDKYFNPASGPINDPNDASKLYPAHEPATLPADDPDVDTDGWHATIDNNDTDKTETGAGLNALGADRILPIAATVTSSNQAIVTWQNAVTSNFGPGEVDQIDIASTNPNTYGVQIFNTTTGVWQNVAGGLTGNQTVNIAPDTRANSVRVVFDDPVTQLAGVTTITGIRNKDVTLNGGIPLSPPDTYMYTIGGGPQSFNDLQVNVTPGVAFNVYQDNGASPLLVGGGVGGGAPTSFAVVNASKVWVELAAPGAVTTFNPNNNVALGGAAFAGTNTLAGKDYYLVSVNGGAGANITNLTISNSYGGAYDVFYAGNPPTLDPGVPGAPNNAGVSGAALPVGAFLTQFWVGVNTGQTITGMSAMNGPGAAAGPAAAPHEFRYDLATPGQTITNLDMTTTNGVSYQVQTDAGVVLTAGIGTGASQLSGPFAAVNPNYLKVIFNLDKGAMADVVSIKPSAVYAPGANTNGFADINNDDTNVAVYQINSAAGWGDGEFDRINIGVKNTHPFTVSWSDDGITWNNVPGLVNVAGTGAPVQYNFAGPDNVIDTNRDGTAFMRVQILSGEKTSVAITSAPVFTNRIDRDGDGWPDVIEVKGGSSPDNAASVPYGAVGGPDKDNDGFADITNLYDPVFANFLASNNPTGATWTNGSGNALNSAGPGAQYPNPGDMVQANQIPSVTDSDGDTIPDPYDPFKNTPEWQTWNDGAGTWSGNLVFVSNRANPNDPAPGNQALYMASFPNAAGTNTNYVMMAGTNGADHPVFSNDGTGLAWEDGTGGITASFITTDCGGAVNNIVQMAAAGKNPTWSPDNSQIAFDSGGKVYVVDVDPAGNGTIYDHNIAGTNPTWSPDGDTVAYTRGGQLYAHNFVTEQEYDLNIAGTAPAFSPDGTRIAYMTPGGDVAVSSLTIDKTPSVIQVGGNNGANEHISLSYPDVRAGKLGISGLSLLNQQNALNAIDLAANAINMVSDYRASSGVAAKNLEYIASDLATQHINLEATRSRIEDADMAVEATALVKSKIIMNASQFATMHASDIMKASILDVIEQTVSHYQKSG